MVNDFTKDELILPGRYKVSDNRNSKVAKSLRAPAIDAAGSRTPNAETMKSNDLAWAGTLHTEGTEPFARQGSVVKQPDRTRSSMDKPETRYQKHSILSLEASNSKAKGRKTTIDSFQL